MQSKVVSFHYKNHDLYILCKSGDSGRHYLPDKKDFDSSVTFIIHGEFILFISKIPIQVLGFEWKSLKDISSFAGDEGGLLCQCMALLWDFFPGDLSQTELLPEYLYSKHDHDKEVIFYGGSFNPWHEGHSECLRQCQHLDVIVIPDRNPWKVKTHDSKNICEFKRYMDIVKRLEVFKLSIYPGFCSLKVANPTVDWVFKTSYNKCSLLIGDDNFFNFLNWKDVGKLVLALNKIFVVPRKFDLSELKSIEIELKKMNNNVEIVYLDEHVYMGLSSTELREGR